MKVLRFRDRLHISNYITKTKQISKPKCVIYYFIILFIATTGIIDQHLELEIVLILMKNQNKHTLYVKILNNLLKQAK